MKLFVHDLHGVLEEGNEDVVLEVINATLKQNRYSKQLTREEGVRLYGRKWQEYFAFLLPQESPERCLELQTACSDYWIEHLEILYKHLKPNDYVHEVLEAIAQKHEQILISNTHQRSLPIFLDVLGIAHFFPNGTAFATSNIQRQTQRTKPEILEDFLKGKNFEDIVIIGDSPSDIALVSVAGGTTYQYSYPGRPFRPCQADYKINDLRGVLREL